MMRKLYGGMLDLLFPRRCPVCDGIVAPAEGLACRACLPKLRYVKEPCCRKCGRGLRDAAKEYCTGCMNTRHAYDEGKAVFEYDCIYQSLYRFKYMGRKEYAEFYGKQAAAYVKAQIRAWKAQALIPVPMYAAKKRQRGYNQAQALAEEMGKHLHLPVYPDLVKRTHRTRPQKELSPAERQNNLKRAFKICANDVKLEVVVLVDDIYTTGSTIDAVAAQLKRAGVRRVFFIALAIGKAL